MRRKNEKIEDIRGCRRSVTSREKVYRVARDRSRVGKGYARGLGRSVASWQRIRAGPREASGELTERVLDG